MAKGLLSVTFIPPSTTPLSPCGVPGAARDVRSRDAHLRIGINVHDGPEPERGIGLNRGQLVVQRTHFVLQRRVGRLQGGDFGFQRIELLLDGLSRRGQRPRLRAGLGLGGGQGGHREGDGGGLSVLISGGSRKPGGPAQRRHLADHALKLPPMS